MDFGIKDNLFDASCIDDSSYINEYYGWESIRNCAYQCAQHPEEISSLWYGLLRSMLYDWKADVKMDLKDAVSICFSSTRIVPKKVQKKVITFLISLCYNPHK